MISYWKLYKYKLSKHFLTTNCHRRMFNNRELITAHTPSSCLQVNDTSLYSYFDPSRHITLINLAEEYPQDHSLELKLLISFLINVIYRHANRLEVFWLCQNASDPNHSSRDASFSVYLYERAFKQGQLLGGDVITVTLQQNRRSLAGWLTVVISKNCQGGRGWLC